MRPVCAGDVPALRSLFQRSEVSTAYGVEHRDPYIRGVGERYTEKTLSTDLASFASLSSVFKKRASEYWVAEHVPSGAVAGMVAVECISPGVGELRRMAVDEAFRRRGLAMRLVLHALDFAQQAGLHTVTLTTQVGQCLPICSTTSRTLTWTFPRVICLCFVTPSIVLVCPVLQ